MERLIKKALKDFKTRDKKPRIDDILSIRGFLSYFFYRNSLPFVRDVSYIIINIVQIIVILKILGIRAAAGGVIGYALILFIIDIWEALKYSLREKIIISEKSTKYQDIAKDFAAMLIIGIFIWLIISAIGISFVKINSKDGYIIMISTLGSILFQLVASSYFMATYTISRVYIPLSYTLGSRIFNLLLGIALMKFIGVYGISFSFFSSRIMDLVITKHFCDKILKSRNISLISKRIRLKELFERIIFLLKPIKMSLKRLMAFTITSADKLILMILVYYYYKSYVVSFFLMIQIINVFLLIPKRISKSMYFDTTYLLKTKSLSMLRLLFNRNFLLTICLGVLFAYVFYLIPNFNLPHKYWFTLVLDLIILDEWFWVCMLIFSYFIIRFINRFLLFSESHISLLLPYLLFEYVLMIYFLLNNQYFLETKEIVVFFSIKGKIGVYYCATLLLIYLSGIWKKESAILNIKFTAEFDGLKNYQDFKNDIKNSSKDDVLMILSLEKNYKRPVFIKHILEIIQNNFSIKSSIRLSENTFFFLLTTEQKDCIKSLNIKAIELLSPYSKELALTNIEEAYFAFEPSKANKKFNPYRSNINIIFPKFFSDSEDVLPNGMDISMVLSKINKTNINYKIYELSTDMGSRYLKNIIKDKQELKLIFELLRCFETFQYYRIESISLKLCSFGIIPIIEQGRLSKIIHMDQANDYVNVGKILFRNLMFRNLKELLKTNDA
jgi:hypothetical protein